MTENARLHRYIESLETCKSPSQEMPRKQRKTSTNTLLEPSSSNVNIKVPNANSNNVNSIGNANFKDNSNTNDNANTNNNANANDNINISEPNNINTIQNKKKIIQAIDTNIGKILKTIKGTQCNAFTIKQNNTKAPIKISINKTEDIPIIRAALKNKNISFHEFKWESEKQQCYIIRGLVGITEDSIQDVFEELVYLGIPTEAKLSRHITGYMRANPTVEHNSLLKLVLPPDFDSQLLTKIKYIDHVAVSFEKLKSKAVVQCMNCQRFGHTSAGCQHTHRCVKCGLNHLRDQCPRSFNKAIKLVCCNCGGEHTANNLSVCPYFIKNFAKNNQPSNPITSSKTGLNLPSTSRGISIADTKNTGISYAAVANLSSKTSRNDKIDYLIAKIADLSEKAEITHQLVLKHDAALLKLTNDG